MDEREMREALGSAHAQQAARLQESQQAHEQGVSTKVEAQRRRARDLQAEIDSWLNTMKTAGRPGMRVVFEALEETGGIFRRRTEQVTQEVAGWLVAYEASGYTDSANQSHYRVLYVLVDGRVLEAAGHGNKPAWAVNLETGYPLVRYTRPNPPEPGEMNASSLIDRLGPELIRVAEQNGVAWSRADRRPS